jgi:iron complex outermembrane receptor protein
VAADASALPPPGVLIVPPATFAAVTIVPGRELVQQQGANLTDALQHKPGISSSTFAPGASRPVIRGFDNNRVRVQENGIGSHDVSALSEDHGVPIDPMAADRIEVVRGPATLRFGGQAIGGVVSATNSRIPEAIPRGGVSTEVRAGVNSVDGGRDAGFAATAGVGNFVAHADHFERHAGDYRTPRGLQRNAFVDAESYAAGGSFVGRDGFFGVSLQRYASLYGIPGGEAETNRTRIDLEQTKLMSRGEWRPRSAGIEAVRYWFGQSDYAHNELSFNADEGRFETGSRFTNRETEGRVEVQHTPVMTALGRLTGAVGVQLGRRAQEGTSFEGDSILALARTRSAAAFLFEELQVSQGVRLQGAVRYEHTNATGTGLDLADPTTPLMVDGDRTFKPVSASAGVLVDVPLGIVMRLTAQHTERAPDSAELYSKGLHEATGTFEIGNPLLTVEKARTFELGFRRAQGAFRFDASLYHTTFDGFIFKRLTGTTCGKTLEDCESNGSGAGGDLRELRFSQRDATFYGAEVIGQLDVAPLWRGVWGFEGQYDFVQAEFGKGEYVPRIPPHRAGAGIYYRDADWLAKVGMLHAFRQEHVALAETPTSGYTLLNAELSYTHRLAGNTSVPQFTVGIKGDNLLNEDMRNHVSFKKDEVLLPGANVRLFGSIKLN